jgi:hypothetical protein
LANRAPPLDAHGPKRKRPRCGESATGAIQRRCFELGFRRSVPGDGFRGGQLVDQRLGSGFDSIGDSLPHVVGLAALDLSLLVERGLDRRLERDRGRRSGTGRGGFLVATSGYGNTIDPQRTLKARRWLPDARFSVATLSLARITLGVLVPPTTLNFEHQRPTRNIPQRS